MSGSTLITHKGALRVSREALPGLVQPIPTDTFRPVPHHILVDTLHAEAIKRGLTVSKEEYAVQHNDATLFGVMDFSYKSDGQMAACIGIRTANNRTRGLKLVAGMRVFVCDNLALSGDHVALSRKHTSGLRIGREIQDAFDRYLLDVDQLAGGIDRLKNTDLSDDRAKALIVDVFSQGIMPVRYFEPVVADYFKGEGHDNRPDPTSWSLHNAFTLQVHKMAPGSAFTATTELGKVFGLTRQNG